MTALPEIIHLGGEHCVTGSCHLLRAHDLIILVDCGIAQGNDNVLPIHRWPIKPSTIDYLFLTHAHIDHIGRLPELITNGFRGEIICSHPTKALLIPMLRDAIHFNTALKAKSNTIIHTIEELSWGFEYQIQFSLKKGITFLLGRAGHILGSCFIRFSIPGSFTESLVPNEYSVLFSGDIGNKHSPIISAPDIPSTSDLLILESTYGDRIHPDKTNRIKKLGETLSKAVADNGKVFIPAFSLGRTQELLFELDRLYSGDTPYSHNTLSYKSIPVFVDSPLGLEITKIYTSLSPFWDKESQDLFKTGDHPFDFKGLYSSKNFREHKKLLEISGPVIIIAGSGMCNGGRITDHLLNELEEPKNDILFVGYQAAGTLGREITDSSKKPDGYVLMKGKKIRIHAKIHTLNGYSAHADQQGLLEFVNSMPDRPGAIKLVHGEAAARQSLTLKLAEYNYNVI